jgi:protease-4
MSARRAVLVFVVLFGVLGAAVLMAALAMRGPTGGTPAETVLVFNVPERLDEAQPPPGGLFDIVQRERPTVWTLTHGLRQAATDPHVVGLVLHIDGVDWGWAKVAEVRDAVSAFRRSGKPVYASLSGGGEREYLLATAADTIASPPLAVEHLHNAHARNIFLQKRVDSRDCRSNPAIRVAHIFPKNHRHKKNPRKDCKCIEAQAPVFRNQKRRQHGK